MRRIHLFVVIVATSVLTACAPAGTPGSGRPAGESTSSTPRAGRPTSGGCEVGSQRDANGSCAPCPDYEGCFTEPSQMSYFYKQVIPWIRDYSKATYTSMSEPAHWYYVQPGQTGDEACTDPSGGQAKYTEHSFEYCPSDENVYVGQTAMWNYYTRLGDAAPAVGLAHEWGHHVQKVAGITAKTRQDVIDQEDQADCIAGAWSAYLVQRKIMVDDDFDDIGELLVAIGSKEGPDRDHGTAEERTASWVKGFDGRIRACNDFVPDHPVIG